MDACLVEVEVEVWIVSKIPRVVKYMHRKGQTAPSTYVKSGGESGVGSGEHHSDSEPLCTETVGNTDHVFTGLTFGSLGQNSKFTDYFYYYWCEVRG